MWNQTVWCFIWAESKGWMEMENKNQQTIFFQINISNLKLMYGGRDRDDALVIQEVFWEKMFEKLLKQYQDHDTNYQGHIPLSTTRAQGETR